MFENMHQDDDDFLTIVTADPQTIYEGGEIKRMGKYSKLLVALYQKVIQARQKE